jgi:hypothetical protein
MRSNRQLFPTALLLVSAACTVLPDGVGVPAPVETLLRVTVFASCLSEFDCGGAPISARRAGPLVFADRDSLVMTDLKAGARVTIRPAAGTLLDVYRGQRRTAGAVAKGAGRGLLAGIGMGVGEALVTKGLGEIVGGDWGKLDLGDLLRTGVVIGGAGGVGAGAVQGAREGEVVWERVTLLQLRQQLCRCARPDGEKAEPAVPLIPGR